MRIKRFELIAYGPFSNYSLDFDLSPQLHIIYGANEAGKSAALRGLKAWLYGIDHQSTDHFIHDYAQLRLGGLLLNEQGEELYFIRRKGKKNTLLGADGRSPIDEKILQAYLQGISKAHFEHFFALDHAGLVAGGQAMVEQQGELGQSLFTAALGQNHLPQISKALEKETEALFKPRAKRPLINQLLIQYDELRQKIRQQALSSHDWQKIHQDLKENRQRLAEIEQSLQQVHQRLHYLQVLQKIQPLLKEEEYLQAQLEQMGTVVLLEPDFSDKRQQAEQAWHQAHYEWQHLVKQKQSLEQKIQAIDYDPHLLQQADLIESFYTRLGSYEKARIDQVHLRSRRHEIKKQIDRIWQQIPQADPKLMGILSRKHYWQKEWIEPYEHLYSAYREAEQAWRKQEQKCLEFENHDPEEWDHWQASLHELQAHLYLDQSSAEKEAQLKQIEAQLQTEFKRLHLWPHDLDALCNYQPPPRAEIEYQQKQWEDLQQSVQQIEQQLADSERDALDIKKHLQRLQQKLKHVPSLQALQQSRQHRDQLWQSIQQKGFAAPLYTEFSRAIKQCDELADRLRQAAASLQDYIHSKAEYEQAQEWIHRLQRRQQEYQQRQQDWQQYWQQLWAPIQALSPAAMLDWLTTYEQIMQWVQQKQQLQQAWQQLQQKKQRLLADCSCEHIAEALDWVQQKINAYQYKQEQINKRQELADRYEQSKAAFLNWQAGWQKEMRFFGLPEDLSVKAAEELIHALEKIDQKEQEALSLKNRIEDIDTDAHLFLNEVAQKIKELAPQFADLPLDSAIRQLNQWLQEQQLAEQKSKQYQAELEALNRRIEGKKIEYENAQAVLDQLCQQAQVDSLAELKQAEIRSQRYQSLQQDWQQLKQRLQIEAGSFQLEQLRQDAPQFDPLVLQNWQQKKDHLEPQRNHLLQEQGRLQKELELRGHGEDQVLQWAEQAESLRAELYEQAEYYLQLKAAQLLLKQSIEYYRQHHQNPLLQKSSAYFERLTLGSFKGLTIDFNAEDQPVLAGEKADGRILHIAAMSKGTQDQLYLALRLAVLADYAERQIKLPLIMDDVLVDFDDQRSQAALSLLAELSQQVQVIIFTHHRHLLAQVQSFDHQWIELKSFSPAPL